MHIPGARRIKVVFDPRCRTETNFDWVAIDQELDEAAVPAAAGGEMDPKKRRHIGRYHGQNGHENFPGFGGRPPLWLEGDRLAACFKSGSTATDWGVRFTAYGIFDENTGGSRDDGSGGEEGAESCVVGVSIAGGALEAAAEDKQNAPKTAAAARYVGNHDIELYCWLLEFLSREGSKVPEVAARLCERDALKVFQDSLKAFSQRHQLRVLRLVSCVIAEARSAARPPGILPLPPATAVSLTPAADNQRNTVQIIMVGPSVENVEELLRVVVGLTDAQRAREGDSTMVSPYLQALVQCGVLLHAFLVSFREQEDGGGSTGRRTSEGSSRRSGARQVGTTEAEVKSKTGIETATAGFPSQKSLKISETILLGKGGKAGGVVQELAAIEAVLSYFAKRTTPVRLLLDEFLPILTDILSVTMQSSHPFNRLAQRSVVEVPGAVAMEVKFDHRTEMGEGDRIIFREPSRHKILKDSPKTMPLLGRNVVPPAPPASATENGGNFPHDPSEVVLVGLSGGTDEGDLPLVSVGDRVVRGSGWVFGNEDGGGDVRGCSAGEDLSERPQVGVVVALEKWGGRDGGGARVQWKGEDTRVDSAAGEGRGYREQGGGFEALYSVQNPAHVRVVKRGGPDRARRPVVIARDALELEVVPGGGGRGLGGGGEEGNSSSAGDDGSFGGEQCFRFDGESTYVDLPSYPGMRLESDFTLEVWAWLDPGTAKDGKPKCVFSRALDQPLPQNKRVASSDKPISSRQDGVATAGPVPTEDGEEGDSRSWAPAEHEKADIAIPRAGGGRGTVHFSTDLDAAKAPPEWLWSGTPKRIAPATSPSGILLPHDVSDAATVQDEAKCVSAAACERRRQFFEGESLLPMGGTSVILLPAIESESFGAKKNGGMAGDQGGKGEKRVGRVAWRWAGRAGRPRSTSLPTVLDWPLVAHSALEVRMDGNGPIEGRDDADDGEDEELSSLDDDQEEDEEEEEEEEVTKPGGEKRQGTAVATAVIVGVRGATREKGIAHGLSARLPVTGLALSQV